MADTSYKTLKIFSPDGGSNNYTFDAELLGGYAPSYYLSWRPIQVNSTQLKSSAISSGPINFKAGNNITLTGSGNDITIASTYNNTSHTHTAGSGLTITGSGGISGVVNYEVNTKYSTTGRNYKVDVDSVSGGLYVNVPWTDTLYTHPSYTAYSSGLYKITTNNLGHVTAATAVTKSDITALGIPGQDTNTTYSAGNGLTLSGTVFTPSLVNSTVATNASSYTAGGTSKFYAVQLDSNKKLGVYVPWTDNNTTYSAGAGITLNGTTIINAGVRSITQDSSDGHKLTINTNGTSTVITIPDNDTTYSAGTGLNLSGTTFSAKLSTSVSDNNNTTAATPASVKSYVDSAISGVTQFKYEIVTSLPTASSSTMNKIYLVSNSGSGNNGYDEYITIQSGTTYKWERFGTTDVNLTNYVNTLSGTANSGVVTNLTKSGNTLTVTSTSLATSSPSSNGSAIQFIDTISQAANGKITTTKKQLDLSAAINTLTTGSATPGDSDYYISQYANGGDTTTTYHRRPMSAMWTWINGKLSNTGYVTKSHTHTVSHTPAGKVSQPTFTGSAVTSAAASGTISVNSMTGEGTLPEVSATIANGGMTVTFSQGTLPTYSAVLVPSTSHTHSVTAAGTVSQPTFTGTAKTLTTSTAS